jgi:hypothetical protein
MWSLDGRYSGLASGYSEIQSVSRSFLNTEKYRAKIQGSLHGCSVHYGLIIKSDRRTRTRPVVADKRVYCHEALALHAKLQDAGFS